MSHGEQRRTVDRPRSPTFSVVIPMYNRGELACRTIGSVYSQTYPPEEIIVVDDGSTDGAAELIRDTFQQVRLIQQDNAGEGAARNAGLAQASSDWIAFVDADDLWLPHHLEELAAVIRAQPEARLVGSRAISYMHGGRFPPVPGARRRRQIDWFRDGLRRGGALNASTAAVHRTVPERCGGFGERRHGTDLGTDLEYWVRIAARFPVAVSDAATAMYVSGVGGHLETAQPAPATWSRFVIAAKRAIADPTTTADTRSMARFVDQLLLSSALRSIVDGDREQAAAILRDLERPRAGWAPAVRGLVAAPPAVVRALRTMYRTVFVRRGS